MADVVEQSPAGQHEDGLNPGFILSVVDAVDRGDAAVVRRRLAGLRAVDLAEFLEIIRHDERRAVIKMLGSAFNKDALSELDETVRDEVIELLEPEEIAAALQEMESDDAVYILEDMDERDQREVLDQMPALDRAVLEKTLEYPEDSAGRLMQRDLVAVPPFWDVGRTIDYMREADELPNEFYEIFVVGPAYKPIGTVPLARLLRTKRPVKVSDIMVSEQSLLPVTMDREDVALQFAKYDLISAAVVDENERLVGVITVDDVVAVINDEAGEDIRHLGGVGEESMSDTVLQTTRGRFSWLLVNLLTAILASAVIGFFDASIEQMVALAILMPIVASMGGNAGTQTMTVAVRAIATRDLVPLNASRIITREVLVGFSNGFLFAILAGVIGGIWFDNIPLGSVLAAAMIINMVVAGFAGILIPLGLERAGVDPAIASTVFLTTITDVVGFFVFLGLAALVLL